jgi:hypothetical protein
VAIEARRSRGVGGQEQVKTPVDRSHLVEHGAPLAARAHIVLAREQAGGETSRPKILSELFGTLDQVLQVQREQLALGGDDLDVGIGAEWA